MNMPSCFSQSASQCLPPTWQYILAAPPAAMILLAVPLQVLYSQLDLSSVSGFLILPYPSLVPHDRYILVSGLITVLFISCHSLPLMLPIEGDTHAALDM